MSRTPAWIFACLWLAGALTSLPTEARTCEENVNWMPVAPGIWAWSPDTESDIRAENGGHVVPTTVVVHRRQALVIDPGPTYAHGMRVRRSLACRFGAQVHWIVNTHAHPESVLGNSAFVDRLANKKLQIMANAGTLASMTRRCSDCLAGLKAILGEKIMAGTRIVLPNRILREGDVLSFGPYRLKVLPTVNGHTESDLLLWEPRIRALWAGGLIYGQRIPELSQGSLDAWLAAIDRIAEMRPAVLIGKTISLADGPDLLPSALVSTRQYLLELRASVLNAMEAGLSVVEARELDLPEYAHWVGYTERHWFNIQRAWRELEPVWMERDHGGVLQNVGRK